jgi:hypothetical protein
LTGQRFDELITDRFDELIANPESGYDSDDWEFFKTKLLSFYLSKDLSDDIIKKTWIASGGPEEYSIDESVDFQIWLLDPETSHSRFSELDQYFRLANPDYTIDDLRNDIKEGGFTEYQHLYSVESKFEMIALETSEDGSITFNTDYFDLTDENVTFFKRLALNGKYLVNDDFQSLELPSVNYEITGLELFSEGDTVGNDSFESIRERIKEEYGFEIEELCIAKIDGTETRVRISETGETEHFTIELNSISLLKTGDGWFCDKLVIPGYFGDYYYHGLGIRPFGLYLNKYMSVND